MHGRELLVAELRRRGIKAGRAAAELGVSRPTIGEWLRSGTPSLEKAVAIAVWSEGRVPAESWLAGSEPTPEVTP